MKDHSKTFTVVLTEDEVDSICNSMITASEECRGGGFEGGILLAFEDAGVKTRALSDAKKEFEYELARELAQQDPGPGAPR